LGRARALNTSPIAWGMRPKLNRVARGVQNREKHDQREPARPGSSRWKDQNLAASAGGAFSQGPPIVTPSRLL